jgi:hypothetical protein
LHLSVPAVILHVDKPPLPGSGKIDYVGAGARAGGAGDAAESEEESVSSELI